MSANYGLLINYEYCDGCHACEVACMKTNKPDVNEKGIIVTKQEPFKKANGKWALNWIPAITEACNFCADRRASGRKPSCVQHCQSSIIKFGEVGELVKEMDAPKMVLYTANAAK